jgi:hypothetical protein
MEVDVVTEIEIERPRAEVAGYATDPDNATEWYRNITRVEWETRPPLRPDSRIAFVARFLGRTIAYTYEVKEFIPGTRLVMATSDGPFAMETTYDWRDDPSGTTRMTLRNRGTPSGFGKLAAPIMAAAMKKANEADLRRLKDILESPA